MRSIGANLARIGVLTTTLLLFVLIVASGSVRFFAGAVSTNNLHLNQLAASMAIVDLIAQNRAAEASVILGKNHARFELLAQRNRAMDAELAVLAAVADPATGSRVAAMKARWASYLKAQHEMVGLVEAGRQGDAYQLFQGALEHQTSQIELEAGRYGEDVRAGSVGVARRSERLATLVIWTMLAVGGVGLVTHCGVHYFVRRRIVAPLAGITASLTDLAEGDMNVMVTGGDRGDEIGAMVRALEVFRAHAIGLDEARHQMEVARARAEALARHDPLTGLPNRRLFIETLTRATQPGSPPCAIMVIDLDRFKPINDAHGHDAGDTVLCELAQRFETHRNDIGMFARTGGDEFAVVVPMPDDAEAVARVARRICQIASAPIALENASVAVGATIGIARFPRDGTGYSELLRLADLAMYEAKIDCRSDHRFFESIMEVRVQERAMLDSELRRAIFADEIRPFYQPLLSIDGGSVVGFEILARWLHPERGMIMPDLFIRAADERDLLTELTSRILRQACVDARSWPEHLRLSLNLEPNQVRDQLLPPRLLAILNQAGFAPSRIEIEITESAVMGDWDATRDVLTSLRAMGMTIALDDFGTGYSSLSHLRDLTLDKIKIDKSFVARLDKTAESGSIVRAMISLARNLGLTTTAEGIENVEQLNNLADWGCNFGQGYLFGKAMSASDASALVTKPAHRTPGGSVKNHPAQAIRTGDGA